MTSIPTTQYLPRFYCDEMLGRLARYLRAAGFDTRLASDGMKDNVILREAVLESRWLVTRDKQILEHKAAFGRVILLPPGDMDSHAATLARRFNLNWLQQPFSRCLVDNTPLDEAGLEQYACVPPNSRPHVDAVKACPCCGRVYWRGSHYRRMKDRLLSWQSTSA
jgi:uncharacterized protein with PIN domain